MISGDKRHIIEKIIVAINRRRRQKDVAPEVAETVNVDFRSGRIIRQQFRFVINEIGFEFIDDIRAELLRVRDQKAGVKLVSPDTPEELVRLLHEEAKAF